MIALQMEGWRICTAICNAIALQSPPREVFLVGGAIGVCLLLIAVVLWLWTLVDCLNNEPSHGSDKVCWVLVILFLPIIGAILYLFVRRRSRTKN
jgi:hypothetical protein